MEGQGRQEQGKTTSRGVGVEFVSEAVAAGAAGHAERRGRVAGRGVGRLEQARQEAREAADDLRRAGSLPLQRRPVELYAHLRPVQVQVPRLRRGPLRGLPLRLHDAPRVGDSEGGIQVRRRQNLVLPAPPALCRPRPRASGPLGPRRQDPLVPRPRRRLPRHRRGSPAALGYLRVEARPFRLRPARRRPHFEEVRLPRPALPPENRGPPQGQRLRTPRPSAREDRRPGPPLRLLRGRTLRPMPGRHRRPATPRGRSEEKAPGSGGHLLLLGRRRLGHRSSPCGACCCEE
mmetsp:Transcript_6048/g.19709  ORF Transcript_6048/g.19709 Transcript_6048/m.19709 type:complete len:290 (-) Transcript_6048:83-952(-)